MSLIKAKRWECKKYLAWIKTLPCRHNMQNGVDPHHIINVLPSGTGTKVHDLFVMPLNREAHNNLHHYGKRVFEAGTRMNQAEEVLKTINQAINEGLIEIKWVGE